MLFIKFLSLFKEYSKCILKSNEKDILMLILMIINQVFSINESGLSQNYLKRIYRFFEKVDQSKFDILTSIYKHLAEELFFKWYNLSSSFRRKNPLIISVDDSIIEKFGKKMKLLRHLKACDGRFVKGYSLLAITISIGSSPSIPLAIFWHKKEDSKSKIKLASETIIKWLEAKLKSYSISNNEIVVCFDNWYLCQEMSCELQRLGVSWVSKLKSNWKISAEVSRSSYPVKQLAFWKNYWVISNLKVKYFFMNALRPNKVFRIWHRSLDVCYATQSQTDNGLIWLASNHLFKHKTMVKLYRLRWKIEVFFKDLKQNLKLSYSHFVDFSKNRFYMEIRILVLTILQLLKSNYRKFSNKTTGELMKQLKSELSQITKNHHNPLIYIQLHLINKTQNPFEALCTKALRL